MMTTSAGRWVIEHDQEVTRACYAQLPSGSGCTCTDCVAFLAQSPFPPEFQALADRLGIDLLKPAELCHCGEGCQVLTGGWYHLVGRILSGADGFRERSSTALEPDFEPLASSCTFGFTERLALVADAFPATGTLQLEFQLRRPAEEAHRPI